MFNIYFFQILVAMLKYYVLKLKFILNKKESLCIGD